MKEKIDRYRLKYQQLLRFILVGAGYAIAYSLIGAVLVSITDIAPLISSTLLYLLFIPMAFYTHKWFTFRSQKLARTAFFSYATVQFICFGLVNMVTTSYITNIYIIDMTIFFVTVAVSALLSFLVSRFIVFRPANEEKTNKNEQA